MQRKDLAPYREQHDAIRQEYAKQAPGWAADCFTDHLAWVIGQVDFDPQAEALDVAAGTELLARQLAPHVQSVVALEFTLEMWAHGAGHEAGNIRFEQGAAEDMPYSAESFDLIATRFSMHHFQEPSAVLAEIYRVCRAGGPLLLIDIVSPDDPTPAQRYNHFERLRDATHTTAPASAALDQLVLEASFSVSQKLTREVEMALDDWLNFNHPAPDARTTIEHAVQDELNGGDATGMRPYIKEERVKFPHIWRIILGQKEA
ncbi:MAG: methyltransferase domain-containing protein [Candidatus Tectomicrobia bacterium]|nr:methyltransferase domain-containing protein [Candidatus Tectomicrobia bacterium]